ncbi:CpsD/CapB family tyrosine-protein kinase [Gymnodinialimonas sp. 2305UL16-5]|uniref:CpsD/CapB family tyrosine-protein kinase n=1 Tax=Gymnodinialimonas mytili TaxID=3126503 RepID=UPI0030B2E5A6
MEKLQKALLKAREQRSDDAPAPHRKTASPRSKAGLSAPSRDALWDAIPNFEPDPDHLSDNRIVAMDARAEATPLDILRTKVQLMMQKNGWTRLAVTSPHASCGKTTIACNLALGLSRQAGIRAALVELDLRRPNVAKTIGHTPDRCVTEMLSGKVSFAEQAYRVRGNVAISAAQRPFPDPTSILLDQRTREALAHIDNEYAPDIVIYDMPPLLVSDDTRAFLKEVDCALLVAKAEATTIAQIDTCEREISEQTNILGVILNQYRHSSDQGTGYDRQYG